jgi:anti-sigma-K factor RskA
MNSDPYDSAAWRTFGMLDAEEQAMFEDAMRHDPGLRRACHEMDRLAAAIAAHAVAPVPPDAEEIERLRRSVGLPHAGRKCPLWLALGGWAAALILAGLLVRATWLAGHPAEPVIRETEKTPAAPSPPGAAADAAPAPEILRLKGEIDDLRKTLEEFHQRDRVLFQVLPGRALQIVMTMVPPGTDPADAGALATPAMLGDALAAINNRIATEHQEIVASEDEETADDAQIAVDIPLESTTEASLPAGPPVAIPIYDAARDAGTLVVSNLSPAARGKVYHLWVTTSTGTRPVFIGTLPESSAAGAESFDFSLGSSMILPAGFILTMDPPDTPAAPSEANTVLAGPPSVK